jgi:hypothetical protein
MICKNRFWYLKIDRQIEKRRDIFDRGKLVMRAQLELSMTAGMYTKVNKMLLLLVDSQSLLSIGSLQWHSLQYWRNLRYTQYTSYEADRTEPR